MTKIIALAAALLCLGILQAAAVTQNPQRMSLGSPYPVYVNNTGTVQIQAQGVYVNQTQFGSSATTSLLFKPTP